MAQINILHLSDLHFAKSNEIDISIIKEAFIKDIKELHETESFTPNIILFTGDLVQSGDDNEFKNAHESWFDPLIEATGLNPDFFIISPGNHDIQRSQIDDIIESGLCSKLNDKKNLNKFLDENLSKEYYFERLKNFNKYKEAINSKLCIHQDILCSTYKFEINGKRVGVSSFNSAWRATGKPNDQDYGKLLIGERQIDYSLKNIEDAHIKIAMAHHPIQALSEFERLDIRRTLLSKYDYLFLGHNHEPSPELIEDPVNRTIISNGGCLYSSREYFNGYSCIVINLETDQVKVIVREYFDKRREFDKALSYIPNGEKTYDLSKESKTDYSVLANSNILSLKECYVNAVNQRLLTSTNRSLAPKEIDEIFVKPPLSFEPEVKALSTQEETKYIDIDKFIAKNQNLLIVGKRESGKTTLLDYIGKKSFENSDPLKTKIPFQINYRNMSSAKNQILKEMYGFYAEANENLDIKSLLKDGRCTIIFDDFAFIGEKKLKSLSEFIKSNESNRYIFAIDENFYQAINLEELPDLGIDMKSVYLHSFRTNEARALTKKWFKYDVIDVDSVLEKTLRTISKINLPRTPVILSIFLWILEKEEDFRPINKASLLERFIDLILEKFSTSEIRYAKIDYRIKVHYLSYIAKKMVEKNNYVMSKFDLEKETVAYFENRGLKTSVSELLTFFISKGIFVIFDDLVFFKYKCFCEFFIAKQMMEDHDFYQEIIKEENYLAFSEELNYLTGLDRNKKDLIEISMSTNNGWIL